MTWFPAFLDAAKDKSLSGTTLKLYLTLVTEYLDPVDYRPLKVTGLAVTLKMRLNTCSRSLKTLCDRGYLARRYVQQQGYEYRAIPVRRGLLLAQSATTHTAA